MKFATRGSRLLAATLFIALQSCTSGSQAMPPASNTAAAAATAMRNLLPARRVPATLKGYDCSKPQLPPPGAQKKPLIYVAGYNGIGSCVLIFRPGIKAPIGEITDGIAYPNGIAFDASGNLYVTNGYNGSSNGPPNTTVSVYPPNKLKPSRTYTGLTLPQSVAVGSDGTVYISDMDGSASGTGIVREYPSGSTTPSTSISLPNAWAFGIALDASNNLYVAWWLLSTEQAVVYKYASGSTSGTNLHLGLPKTMVPVHTLAFDTKGNLVMPVETGFLKLQKPQYLAVYAPGSSKVRKIWLGSLANLVFGVAFPRSNPNVMYITGQNSSDLLELTYPHAQVRAASPVPLGAGIALTPGM